jgi:hypothetical protein
VSDAELEALEWAACTTSARSASRLVLLKQERLTRDERASMNAHPVPGAEIIGRSSLAPGCRSSPPPRVVQRSGYPDRLVGDDLPPGPILHVADAFEAMTAARPYRMTPLTPEHALAELRKFGGIQFDPAVVEAFTRTRWGRDLADPGRPQPRQVPLIGSVAGGIGPAAASGARPA